MNLSIWNEHFWLPKNTSWKDFNELEQNGIPVPRFSDLIYVYPLAGVLYITRLLFEYCIAQPIGRSIGLRDHRSHKNQTNKKLDHCKSSDNTQQQYCTRPGPLAKFSESTWRFTFYLSIFIYGVMILKNVK
jgi:hypothetical protein